LRSIAADVFFITQEKETSFAAEFSESTEHC
jgi:hypothetical protein